MHLSALGESEMCINNVIVDVENQNKKLVIAETMKGEEYKPILVTSWEQFVEEFGVSVDWDKFPIQLTAFRALWDKHEFYVMKVPSLSAGDVEKALPFIRNLAGLKFISCGYVSKEIVKVLLDFAEKQNLIVNVVLPEN